MSASSRMQRTAWDPTLGLSGDAAVTSFYATKVFTGGEGGAILTDDPELDEFVRKHRNFGKPSPWVTHHESRGWNYRMQEFAAHLVSEQLADADEILAARRRIAATYVEHLGDRIVGHRRPTVLVQGVVPLRQAGVGDQGGAEGQHDGKEVRSERPFPAERLNPKLCIFEFVYSARPDTRLYGNEVHGARRRMGQLLATQAPVPADLVMGVPDSGVPAAEGYAVASGIPYGQGLVKNRYIGRTFIAPTQAERANGVRRKLNPLRETSPASG